MKTFGKNGRFEAFVIGVSEADNPEEVAEKTKALSKPDHFSFTILDLKHEDLIKLADCEEPMTFRFSTAEEAHMAVDYIAEIVNRAVDDE